MCLTINKQWCDVPNTYGIINKNLYELISSFVPSYYEFSRLLRDNGAILSGSSMLQVITLDDITNSSYNYSCSDMDIYVKHDQYDEIVDYFNALGYVCTFYKTKADYPKYRRIEHFDGLMIFEKRDKSIDLIISDDPINCIKHYDFSFLLNWYDGTSVKIVHPESIINRVSLINYRAQYINPTRIVKYRRRGYNIVEESVSYDDFNWDDPYEIPMRSSLDLEVQFELVYSPPNMLLPFGGLMYQEAMSEFNHYVNYLDLSLEPLTIA